MSINIKEAVARAFQFVKDMYEENKIENVLLEEITQSADSDSYWWEVTVSFMQPAPPKDVTELFSPKEYTRSYKVISIDTNTGEVTSMRDRSLQC